MKKILFDTNAYVAFKRGDEVAIDIARLSDKIGVSAIVLGELLAGFELGSRKAKNCLELKQFLDSSRVIELKISGPTANFYANIFRQLKQKGKPIPSNDMWIAASALENGFHVYTYDKHFGEIDGLLVGKAVSDFIL